SLPVGASGRARRSRPGRPGRSWASREVRAGDTRALAGGARAQVGEPCECVRKGAERRGSDLADVGGLKSLGTLDHLELHVVAFSERPESLRDDGGVVNENVLATFLRDEAKPLRVVEPLDRALRHCHNLLKWEPAGPGETPSPRGRVKKPQKKSRSDLNSDRPAVTQESKGGTA